LLEVFRGTQWLLILTAGQSVEDVMSGKCIAGLAGFVIVAASVVGAAQPASAATVAVTGSAAIVTAPASVARNAFESSTQIRVFDESSITLGADLTVWMPNATGTMTQTIYNKRACIQSHMVHMDTTAAAPTVSLLGGATFSQAIIGVIPLNIPILRPLDNTDPGGIVPLGKPGTTYGPAGDGTRGFEPIITSDQLTWNAATPNALGFRLGVDGFDEVRVLTLCDPPAVVPELPLAVGAPLSVVAVLGAAMWWRRRRPSAAVALG
jgi:hypothetical protein